MTEQLRPVDRAGTMAVPYQHEIELLDAASAAIRQARVEFHNGFAIAARLEVMTAVRLLDRAFHGEVV